MKQAISRVILAATALFFPLAAFSETLTYYDCRNADGSMSYRIFPCNKGQQEIRRQKNTLDETAPLQDIQAEPETMQPTRAISTPEFRQADRAQRDFAVGEAAYKLGKDEDAATWYRKAAEQGFAQAQYNMGSMYEKGQGVMQDYPQAVSWYRKAAGQEFVLAQFSMGVMYDIGQGITQDYQQAMFWYAKAAERGNVKAQNNLGFMYSQGKGVAQNYVAAHMWFNISGVRGYEEGRKNREFVEKLMTPAQIAEAQQQAGEWMKAHP
jgi:TPR repeat protein